TMPVRLTVPPVRFQVPRLLPAMVPPIFRVPPEMAIVPGLDQSPLRLMVEFVSVIVPVLDHVLALMARVLPLMASQVPWLVQLAVLRVSVPPAPSALIFPWFTQFSAAVVLLTEPMVPFRPCTVTPAPMVTVAPAPSGDWTSVLLVLSSKAMLPAVV